MPDILFDGRDAFREGGTGIATYARTLGALARDLGFHTGQVVSSAYRLDARDPTWSEIRFGDVGGTGPRLLTNLRIAGRATAARFADIRPVRLPTDGPVIDTTGARAAFEETFASYRLFDVAEVLYRAQKRRTVLRFDRPPALFHATAPMPLMARGAANIYTIHDVIPILLPAMSLTDKRFFYDLVREICDRADHVITVSECSRRDIIRLTGMPESRITNTYQSVSLPPELLARSEDAVAAEVENVFQLDMGGYYLFFGAVEPKKNVMRLIDGYVASGTRRPLVLAGGFGWQCDAEAERLKDERFLSYRIDKDRVTPVRSVRQVGHLPFAQLISLIRGARALVFPSIYEGFGLPVLEAMLLGTPVITSNAASLPEIAGDAALFVDPLDVSSIAEAIRTLDHDDDLRNALAARGRDQAAKFSLDAYRARMAAIYKTYAG